MNPWEEIPLDDYENHMSLESVNQLQTLNMIMKEQLSDHDVADAMILGVAGGNGLEYVDTGKYKAVYGVDINEGYLNAARERHPELDGILQCICLDLTRDAGKLPETQLLIADLLIEYIGYDVFLETVRQTGPEYVSCVIQINTDAVNWVSDSPYLHSFDRLDEVHHQMEEDALISKMQGACYEMILQKSFKLPNGKALVRLDFRRQQL